MKKYRIKSKKGLHDKSGSLMGDADKATGIIRINPNHKAHKKDKSELASTIKHEIMHIEHPKMWEKTIYKKTAKSKLSDSEVKNLIAKFHKNRG